MDALDTSGRSTWWARLRGHRWTSIERAGVIAALAIVMGSLFVTTYTLALGDPVPRSIDAALVGDAGRDAGAVKAVQGVAENSLDFTRYESLAAARDAIDRQRVYAALDLTSAKPTLYVASAAGASVARLLEKVFAVDPSVQVVDAHPLASTDPSGLDIFYLMLVATIVGFITVFQTRALAGGLPLRRWTGFVVAFALAASLALTPRPVGDRPDLPVLRGAGQHLVGWRGVAAAAAGAVRIHLAVASVGATVTSVRDAIYFPGYQHARPILVLAAWATALFVAMLVASNRRGTSPGGP